MIPFLQADIEGTIGGRFETVAHQLSDAIAIANGDKTWTYREVLTQSERYRENFARLKQADPIALVFGHNAEAIIALMGAIRAGIPVIPIDPLAPPQNIYSSIDVCQAVLTEPKFEDWCRENVGPIPVVVGSEGLASLDDFGPKYSIAAPKPNTPCIIFLTSGTTGAAKRPFRTHRALCRHIWQLPNHHGYGPMDRQAHISSFAFGGSVPVVLGALLTGGTIDIFNLRGASAAILAQTLSARGITILQLTPSLMRELTDILSQRKSSWQPRLIVVGGEKLYVQDLLGLREKLGWDCPVVHRLASSEAGVIAEWCVDTDVIEQEAMVPVGYPVENRKITIVDDDGSDLPIGEIGEIIITGDYMSNGYWGRQDLTQEKFSPAPTFEAPMRQRYATGDLGCFQADGMLSYFGRKDSMVKIRGYRVETGAVENAIRAVTGVTNAAVLTKKNNRNGEFLLGYAQRAQGADITAFSVRRQLQKHLPDYMVPRQIIVLDAFPLTAGGKVAAHKLPELDRCRPQGMSAPVTPQGATETLLAQVWSEVLEIDEISRDDNFFDLGGDSLEVLHVAMTVQKHVGETFAETDLFAAPDLKAMAMIVSNIH